MIWKIKEEFVPLYFRKIKDYLGCKPLCILTIKIKSGSFLPDFFVSDNLSYVKGTIFFGILKHNITNLVMLTFRL